MKSHKGSLKKSTFKASEKFMWQTFLIKTSEVNFILNFRPLNFSSKHSSAMWQKSWVAAKMTFYILPKKKILIIK